MLLLAQLLKSDSPPYKGMPTTLKGKIEYAQELWTQLIEEHFKIEEKELFPFVENESGTLNRLSKELIKEHYQIREYFEKISESNEDELDSLGRLIELHVRKEERAYFQEIQQTLDEESLSKLKTALSKA